jgi:hypothetical protein
MTHAAWRPALRLLWILTFCPLSELAHAQATPTEDFDVKTIQLMRIVEGKLFLRDIYTVRRVSIAGSEQVFLRVMQNKVIEQTQSCGQLTDRSVAISRSLEPELLIPAAKFKEFVGIINFYTKFRDRWENIAAGKAKIFQYEFGDGGRLRMSGDKDRVTLELSSKNQIILSTQDLRLINSISDNINDVQKFLENHKFDQCL